MGKKKNQEKKPEKPEKKVIRKIHFTLTHAVLSAALIILIILTYQIILINKFYPLTYIGNINVSFLTKSQSSNLLSASWEKRLNETLVFNYQDSSTSAKQYSIKLASTGARIDYSIIEKSFNAQHSNNIFNNLREEFRVLFQKNIIQPTVEQIDISFITDKITSDVAKKPVNATITYNEITSPQGTPSAVITVEKGLNGIQLGTPELIKQIKNYLIYGSYNSTLPVNIVEPDLTEKDLEKSKKILENLSKNPLTLRYQTSSWEINSKQLVTILNLEKGNSLLNQKKAMQYIENLASDIDQNVVEGQFEFDANSKKVAIFKPSQEGRKLNREETYALLITALENQTKNIDLPVDVVKPKVQTTDVNNLGIKELLGRGISNFAGSIPNRIFNVGHTANKINGTLVAPGEVFSFNQTVGDISAATGFKQAYVIKAGRTVLDDGGGVCQDSTTLFRAVLNAGLPVVKRTAHAYRVGYYEQGFPPGLDATVYYPSVDFQFKNDTSAHILIQAYTSGLTLYIDLYGSPDGRTVNITKPIVSNITPAPPELRQDDPTLPKGTVKQVDWAANGATVKFYRTVEKNGETTINETWTSNYKAWQAVYLVGTQ